MLTADVPVVSLVATDHVYNVSEPGVGEVALNKTCALAVLRICVVGSKGSPRQITCVEETSVGVIPRLIDMGVKSFLIPSTLRVAISQRLIRVLCSHCKKKTIPNEKIKNYILSRIKNFPAQAKKEFKIPEPLYIYEAKGCELCNFMGYAGRMGLFEVLSMTNELAELILKNPVESLILKVAQKQGMLTMEQEGILKVLQGETTVQEITRVTDER